MPADAWVWIGIGSAVLTVIIIVGRAPIYWTKTTKTTEATGNGDQR